VSFVMGWLLARQWMLQFANTEAPRPIILTATNLRLGRLTLRKSYVRIETAHRAHKQEIRSDGNLQVLYPLSEGN